MNSDKYRQILLLKALLSTEGIGGVRLFNLISAIGGLEEVMSAEAGDLVKIRGIEQAKADAIRKSLTNLSDIEDKFAKELTELDRINANIITYLEPEYPNELKNIYDPPVMLYYLGDLSITETPSIAVVGTRMPTNYGKIAVHRLATGLARNEITIVSGLARGIDTLAHLAALENNGTTIAVTGAGLDVIYPPENNDIYHKIAETGLILSEFAPGTKPDAQNFPKRNRIISGLSMGTLIVETRPNGGAMQTAAFALDQNREVFSVPGNINSEFSEGTNRLIQRGEAKLVQTADDILIEFENKLKALKKKKTEPAIALNLFEQTIYEVITYDPVHIDAIADKSGISVSECLIHLLNLEFNSVVKQLPGKYFIRL